MHKKIILCDFDGTLIRGDSLFMFLRFAKGSFVYYLGLVILLPILILGFLGLISNHRTKEIMLSYYLKNNTEEEINKISTDFKIILNRKNNIQLLEKINIYKENGYDVYIVSASILNWIRPWAESNGINNIISTQLEFINNKFTGKFLTPNCNGEEKVRRIREVFVNREELYIISFGDSKGDYPMFKYSDEFYQI